jgi:Na+-transporting methylmalonyl-CoA/oxaloacetate decarboxylase gamma subunit
MWWIAALLSAIVWVLAWSSGFLGPVAHVFLLLALLALLAQALDLLSASTAAEEAEPPNESSEPPPVATGGAERATAEAGDEEGRDGAG